MPKLLVVFSSIDAYAAHMANVVADGAKTVRFMEVDVRAVADVDADVSDRRRLTSLDAVRDYDGVILVGPGPESLGHELSALLEWLANTDPLTDTVFGFAGEENAEMLMDIAQSGGLMVTQPRGADAEDRARKLGARAAKVIGWVRHALGHETQVEGHSYSHGHHGDSHDLH